MLPKNSVWPEKISDPPSKSADMSVDSVYSTLILVSVILIVLVESDFRLRYSYPSASVPALETENGAPLYLSSLAVEVVVSNSPAK